MLKDKIYSSKLSNLKIGNLAKSTTSRLNNNNNNNNNLGGETPKYKYSNMSPNSSPMQMAAMKKRFAAAKKRDSLEVKSQQSKQEVTDLVNTLMAKHKKQSEKEFLKLRDELGEIKQLLFNL